MSEPPMPAVNALSSVGPRLIAAMDTKDQITLPSLAQSPLCPKCAIRMFLARSQPGRSSSSITCTYECPVCGVSEIVLLKPHAMERLGEAMPFRHLLEDVSFSSEQLRVMGEAYEAVRSDLHDSGQPAIVNEIIAKRIIDLAKLKAFDAKELASRALTSFGLQNSN